MDTIIEEIELLRYDDELSIQYESDPSEASIVGTRSAYINAALNLLKIANSALEVGLYNEELENKQVKCTNSIKYIFNEHGTVFPIVAIIAETNEQTSSLSKYLGS